MTKGLSMASLSLYVLSFNCAHNLIDVPAFSSQLFNGLDDANLPDLIVLSLQEISTISQGFIGGTSLLPYFARFQDAVQMAAKKLSGNSSDQYTPIVSQNIGITAIMVFARDPATVGSIETAAVGLGPSNMGNKGAVGVRLMCRDVNDTTAFTELTFVAVHLAAFEGQVERRNEDWKNIVRGLVFSSTTLESSGNPTSLSTNTAEDSQPLLSVSSHSPGIYKPTSHLFVAGDLNYRTSNVNPSPVDHRDSFPQPHHEEDHPQHYYRLLDNDELTSERRAGRACHGLLESDIDFPPTYKYNPKDASASFLTPDEEIDHWSWATHRWPSWCDRILYLDLPEWLTRSHPDAKLVPHKYIALPLFPSSDHRAVAQRFDVPLLPIPEPELGSHGADDDSDDPRVAPPFEVNPDWRAERQKARRMELFSGFSMYLTGTWEGWCLMVGTAAGLVGAGFLLRAALDI